MKKFLAALLVVVMVVSMIPATVFAATTGDEECAVEKKYGTHSKAFCTAEGVTYAQVGETVAPECGQDGYTMYLCACGTYFADDIIDMPEHEHADGVKPVSARVEPTCSTYGTAAFYTCIHCAKTYPEYESEAEAEAAAKLTNAPAGAIAKLAHTFASDSYIGNDCTAKTQQCTVCGEVVTKPTAQVNKKHNFDYSDPHAITTVPGTCTPGVATFKCQTEGCDAIDTVAVDLVGHNKDAETMTFVKEKAPKDCNTTGIKAHWVCDECDALFLQDEEDPDKLVPATAEDLVIVPEHQAVYAMDWRIPACGEEGFITYKCSACNAKSWTVDFPALPEHTTLAQVLAHNELAKKDEDDDIYEWDLTVIELGCPEGTTYYWECHNPYCGDEKTLEAFIEADILDETAAELTCAEELEWTDPATEGHTEYTVKVPAAYHPLYNEGYAYTYTLVYCTNPECTMKDDAQTGWDVVYEDPEDPDSDYWYLNVSLLVKNGKIYEMTPAEQVKYTFVEVRNVREVKIKQTADCKNLAHYYEHDASRNQPATCTAAGTEYFVCANPDCRDDDLVTVAKLEHVWDYYNELGKSDGYKCATSCYTYCLVCKAKKSSSKSTPAHVSSGEYSRTIEVPNCQEKAGDYYFCLYCDKDFIPTGAKSYSYTNRYDDLKAAVMAHFPQFGELSLEDMALAMEDYKTNERAGTCYTVGRVEYKCSECSKYFWVYDSANTGKHKAPAGTVYHEEATCFNGAGYETFTCDREGCDVVVKAAAPLDHIMTKTAKKNATCTEGGNVEYYTCSRDCCQYETEDEDGNEITLPYIYQKKTKQEVVGGLTVDVTYYVDITGTEKTDKLNHNFEAKGSAPVSCVTAGYTYYLCANGCGSDYVTDLEMPTGHEMGAKVEIDANCVEDGRIFYECVNEWCTGDDGLACTCELELVSLTNDYCTCKEGVDDGVYTDEETGVVILPALGHINAAGQMIVDSCLDTVTNRVCVRVSCPLEPAASGTNKGKKVVAKSHDKVENEVAATCENPAYILTTCANGCGKINEVKHIADALGHEFAWGGNAGPEFVNSKLVAEAGAEFLKDAKTFKKTYGDKAIIAYTPATYEAKGSITFTCEFCKNEITMDVLKVGVDFALELDNAVVPGASYIYDVNNELAGINIIDGDVLAVTVNMSAFQTNVWGFNFDLMYNATALNFLGYKFAVGDVFANFMVNNVLTDDVYAEDINNDGKAEVLSVIKNAVGELKVSAYTENALDGKMFEAEITGTKKVVTLYFQVEAQYTETYLGIDELGADEAVAFFMSASAADTEDDLETEGDVFIGGISTMMDTNANGNFNITDVQNCVKIIKGQSDYEYLASCDVNKDGVVNLTDLDLMNKTLVGKIGQTDAYEIYKTLAWKAPEGFVAA